MIFEINDRIVKQSIVRQINDYFNTPTRKYAIYTENIRQGFKRPCFYIRRVTKDLTKGYTSSYKQLTNVTSMWEVSFFPVEATENEIEQIDMISDDLEYLFSYLDLFFIDNEGIEYKASNQVRDRQSEIADKVFHTMLYIDYRTVHLTDVDKVQHLEIDVEIKTKEEI